MPESSGMKLVAPILSKKCKVNEKNANKEYDCDIIIFISLSDLLVSYPTYPTYAISQPIIILSDTQFHNFITVICSRHANHVSTLSLREFPLT